MRDLEGKVVEVTKLDGRVIEGVHSGVVFDGVLPPMLCLRSCREINYKDEQRQPPTVEAWDVPDPVYVAVACVVQIHPSHLGPRS